MSNKLRRERNGVLSRDPWGSLLDEICNDLFCLTTEVIRDIGKEIEDGEGSKGIRPVVRFKETESDMVFEIELPGYKKSEINIEVDKNNRLSVVAASKRWDKAREHVYRARLSKEVDIDTAVGRLSEGILYLSIPIVKEKQKSNKMIPIE